jgi:hypothetical protein
MRAPSKKFGRRDRDSQAAYLISDGCYVAAFRSAFNSGVAVINSLTDDGHEPDQPSLD